MHITKMVDWDSPKGDISQFVRMSQDHTHYNMSAISVNVQGILDLKKMAEILCPTSRNTWASLLAADTDEIP